VGKSVKKQPLGKLKRWEEKTSWKYDRKLIAVL
jgi:hypothetical protein